MAKRQETLFSVWLALKSNLTEEEEMTVKKKMSKVSMEQAVIKVANKEDFQNEVKVGVSCFKDDLWMSELNVQLPLLHDIIKKAIPEVKIVTSIHTICNAINRNEVLKELLPAVHKLLCLYLTIPITSATTEKTIWL